MHKIVGAACRRTAGLAAGLVVTGGVFGGVLLTPGTAFASTAVDTTTAITGTTQTTTWHGTTLNVQVSVTPASGTAWPGGTVKVSDGSGGCFLTLAEQGSTAAAVGDCNIYNLPDGIYPLTAAYEGTSSFNGSASNTDTVSIRHDRINIATYLNCTPRVFTGQQGSCTLWVTNRGSSPAPDVTARIALPSQLRANYCNFGFFFNFGCRISNNTAFENLGTLNPGQTKKLTVVFTAKTGFSLRGWHRGHPFTVKVVGLAASNSNWWFGGQRVSFSTAYVTVIPHGHWW
jgi:hypothetical protein